MTRRQSASVLQAALVATAIAGAVGAAPVRAEWPLWDGKESVADYATREENACKAGSETRFPWGDNWADYAFSAVRRPAMGCPHTRARERRTP